MDRNQEGVSKTREDYLEAILMIWERQGYVRSVDVAEQLGVAKPSVTYTTKRLRENGYITADPNGMLILTDTGREIAERCKVEHDLSEETYRAILRHVQKYRPDLEKMETL